MPKGYKVGDTTYQFPDDFTDEQAARVLTEQGIIKPPPKGGLKGDPGMGKGVEGRFLGRMAEGVEGLWNLGKSVVSPRSDLPQVPGVPQPVVAATDVMRQLITPREDLAKEAAEAFKRGGVRGTARGVTSTIEDVPLFGGIARQAEEDIRSGNIAGLTASGVQMLAPAAANRYLPKTVRLNPLVRNLNNPVEEAALASVESPGAAAGQRVTPVPMTAGQRTGRLGLQRKEASLENYPGSATRAQGAKTATQDALAQRGSELAALAGGTKTNAAGVGKAVMARLQNRIANLKGRADALYNQVRQETAANKQTVQIGTQSVPGSNPAATLTPAGMPRTVPLMASLETPVDLGPIRQGLTPIYEDLKRALPDARRANSPAWRDLEELMTSKNQQMSAMDFDKTLSAVKTLARDGDSKFLSSQSQRVAKQIIANGEAEFQKAIAGAGPNTLTKLKQARDAVRAYHNTAEFLQDLSGGKPDAIYSDLVTGGDHALSTLQELQRIAPNETRTVGRTFLEGLVEKATNEGGFGRSAGIKADWQRLGPETKQLLFGKELTSELDKFMLAAKRLTREFNPSGTKHMDLAAGAYGAPGRMIAELFGGIAAGHPGLGALAATSEAARSYVIPSVAARLLTTPGGTRLLTQAINLPVRTPAFAATMTNLGGLVAEEQRKERQQSPWQVPPLPQ